MPYAVGGLLHLIIVAFFAFHVMRSGRPIYWITIMLAFPLMGCAIYFFMEYLPEMRYSKGGRKVLKAVEGAVNPNRALREAEREFERSPTVGNRAQLAAALSELGRHEEAVTHYAECASGAYANDAHFVRGLAATNLLASRWQASRDTYERLFAISADARTTDDDLGYAYALSQLDDEGADAAFRKAVDSSTGPVARCRYAQFLQGKNRQREARELYEAVVKEGQLAPKHTRDLHKAWYRLAKESLAELG